MTGITQQAPKNARDLCTPVLNDEITPNAAVEHLQI